MDITEKLIHSLLAWFKYCTQVRKYCYLKLP